MYALGIDISANTYTASCLSDDFSVVFFGKTFEQSTEGWTQLLTLLKTHKIRKNHMRGVIMESTGVYGERLCHFFFHEGFSVYVEPPHRIKKAFYEEDKDDPIDSRQIAEYLLRYPDKLHPWQPPNNIVEEIHLMLSTWEQLTKMQTACKNISHSLSRKQREFQHVQQVFLDLVAGIETQKSRITKNLTTITETNPLLHQQVQDILAFKNVGILIIAYLIDITNGFTEHTEYTSLSKYIGICPLKHKSGTSINRKPRSRGHGPRQLRKQFYLCAMRMRKNDPEFRKYFERKFAEGKEKRLILNNIENKVLRIICGIIKSGKPYMPNYRSIKPDT